MSVKVCKRCHRPFDAYGTDNYLCKSCSDAYFKSASVRDRICRQCGAIFQGGPRAWYCPDCRLSRRREADRRHKKHGTSRPLGSVDKCANCGADYIVNSARQRYCKACADSVVADHIRQRSREYNQENRDHLNAKKQQSRRNRSVCKICGAIYDAVNSSVTCSPACRKKLKKLLQDEADIRRGRRKSPAGVYYDSGRPKSGVVGVTASDNGRWRAAFRGKYLGTYDTIQEASQAIETYKKEHQENDK